MDFKAYFYGLSNAEREAFAYRAGTTVRYIQCHLVNRRKIPRRRSLLNLASASKGQVTLNDLLTHFYRPVAREVHRSSVIDLVPTCSGSLHTPKILKMMTAFIGSDQTEAHKTNVPALPGAVVTRIRVCLLSAVDHGVSGFTRAA